MERAGSSFPSSGSSSSIGSSWRSIWPEVTVKLILRSILYVIVLTALLGGAYPAAVRVLAKTFWPGRADGSFARAGDRVVGSELIGQNFRAAKYLHPRPSA